MTPTLLSTNTTDGSVTFSIDGARWEYFFPIIDHIRTTLAINKKSCCAALNYAKKWAMRERKVEYV